MDDKRNERGLMKASNMMLPLFYLRNKLVFGNGSIAESLISKQRRTHYSEMLEQCGLLDYELSDILGDHSVNGIKNKVSDIYSLVSLLEGQLLEMTLIFGYLSFFGSSKSKDLNKWLAGFRAEDCDRAKVNIKALKRAGLLCSNNGKLSLTKDVWEGIPEDKARFCVGFAIQAAPFSGLWHSMLRILDANAGVKQSNWNDEFAFEQFSYHQILDECILWTMLSAYSEKLTVKVMVYSEKKKQFNETEIYPLRAAYEVVHGRTYLYAYDLEEKTVKHFRMDYLANPVLSNPFSDEDDRFQKEYQKFLAEIRNAWSVNSAKKTTRVVVQFVDEAGIYHRVSNERREGTLYKRKDGKFLYQVEVADCLEMKPWLLTFGEKCKVLEPDMLKVSLCKTYREMLEEYGETSGGKQE